MSDRVKAFYDELAESYHLLFQDWTKSIAWQSGILGPLVERELPLRATDLKILDCACGIGTQSLALAQRGHAVFGVDLSAAAVQRAQREAALRGLPIEFQVADMRDLSGFPEAQFDLVMAVDNCLPHLLCNEDLWQAARQIAGKLRAGGLFLATLRDYDDLLERRPATLPPAFFQDGASRRIYHQVWDWTDERQYTVHLYLTQETGANWVCRHFISTYRAVRQQELTAILLQAGFGELRWLMPSESGFYQPLLLARRSG